MTPPEPALAVRVTRDVPVAAAQVSSPNAQIVRGLATMPSERALAVAEGEAMLGEGWGAAGTAFVFTNGCAPGAAPAAWPGAEKESVVRATRSPIPTKRPIRTSARAAIGRSG